ncbi:MAG: methyltransferase domain-containing protein [Planctomycetota bacterium]
MNGFNRIFTDTAELAEPALRGAIEELAELRRRFAAMGLPLRCDHARDWEHARVLCEVDAMAAGGVRAILDVGGGNSALAWVLVRRGHRVCVLDPDRAATAAVASTSRSLHWGHRVTVAEPIGGVWPVGDAAFDLAVCVSVFEGILRRDRPRFFGELRRVLRPGGDVLLTFDFGHDARFLGDAPATIAEVERDIVSPSGLRLVGLPLSAPRFDATHPPPVCGFASDAAGHRQPIAYTFAALHLQRDD